MSRQQELFQLPCKVLGESAQALKIEHPHHGVVWIPLSQIERIDHFLKDESATVWMTQWIAKQKGFL